MKYFAAAATLIAAVQAAAIGNTNFDSVAAGQTFTITWYDASGPVSLDLRNGASGDLKQLATLTSGASSTNGAGSYTWTVPATLDGAGPYAFVITDSTGVNYSVQFPISGINVDAPASKTATTTAAQTTPTADITTVQSKTATSVAAEAVTTTGTVTSVTMVQVPPTTSHTVEFQSSSSLIPHSSSKVPSTMSTQVSTSGAVSAPTSAPTSVPTSVPEQGKAVGMASPFALILVSVAAMFYLQ